jgi:hypothetical protein
VRTSGDYVADQCPRIHRIAGDDGMGGFPKYWARIAALGALLADATPRVLWHSFASVASDLGYSEPTIQRSSAIGDAP